MQVDIEVLLAMLMLPAIGVCWAVRKATHALRYHIVITCPISSVTAGRRGTKAKRDQTREDQDQQTHKQPSSTL